jgi:hypothetical protein
MNLIYVLDPQECTLFYYTELAPDGYIVITGFWEPADLDALSKQDAMGRTAKVEHSARQLYLAPPQDQGLTRAHLPS